MNQNKERLRELWERYKALLSQTSPANPSPLQREARELYEKEIWPLTKEGFKDRSPEGYVASFHTVGTTQEPVVLSIKAIGAEKVFLLHTKDTARVCGRIQEELGLGLDRIRLLEVGRSDPEDIYNAVRHEVDKLDPTASIAFDPTGGTKAMVAGLAMFAFSLAEEGRKADVYYVDNEEYDEQLRRPVAGTEFLKRLENPREVFADWIYYQGLKAYQQANFARAEELFTKAAERENKAHSLEGTLASAYKCLDAAKFEESHEKFVEFLRLLEKPAHRQSPLKKYAETGEQQKEGLERIIELVNGLKDKQRDISFLANSLSVAWALAALEFMALRRQELGRTAEAVLLRYRALELFFQHRLALRNFDTAKPDFQLLSDDLEELQKNYQNKRSASGLKNEDVLKSKSAVDFVSAYFLLLALDDEAAISAVPNRLVGLTRDRNQSVFAHGFTPPKEETARDLSDLLIKLLRSGNLPEVAFEPIPLA